MPLTKQQRKDNAARAFRARRVLYAYTLHAGADDASALTDLLADLLHQCGAPAFDKALATARMHHEAESEGRP
jgi:hypothetical protein